MSLDRVNKFMNNEELQEEAVTHVEGGPAVEVICYASMLSSWFLYT